MSDAPIPYDDERPGPHEALTKLTAEAVAAPTRWLRRAVFTLAGMIVIVAGLFVAAIISIQISRSAAHDKQVTKNQQLTSTQQQIKTEVDQGFCLLLDTITVSVRTKPPTPAEVTLRTDFGCKPRTAVK